MSKISHLIEHFFGSVGNLRPAYSIIYFSANSAGVKELTNIMSVMISSIMSVNILISICELRSFQFWPEFKFRSPSLNFPVTLLCQPRVKSCSCLNFNWTKYIDFFLKLFGFLPEYFWDFFLTFYYESLWSQYRNCCGIITTKVYYSCNCISTIKCLSPD